MLTKLKSAMKPSDRTEQGFTIVELMIAMTVFSFILVMVTVSFVQIGRLFYKGVTVARTQEATRGIISNLTGNLQFQSNAIVCENTAGSACGSTLPAEGVLCVGNTHYFYRVEPPKSEAPDTGTIPPSYLSLNTTTDAADCDFDEGHDEAQNLLGDGMRLIDINARCDAASELCDVLLELAFGDRSLMRIENSRQAQCLGGVVGSQFCAVSRLSSSVIRRVE